MLQELTELLASELGAQELIGAARCAANSENLTEMERSRMLFYIALRLEHLAVRGDALRLVYAPDNDPFMAHESAAPQFG